MTPRKSLPRSRRAGDRPFSSCEGNAPEDDCGDHVQFEPGSERRIGGGEPARLEHTNQADHEAVEREGDEYEPTNVKPGGEARRPVGADRERVLTKCRRDSR